MKMLFVLLLLPFGVLGQIWTEPRPDTVILKVEICKDTLFVYQEINVPPHNMAVIPEWRKYRERWVYVIRKDVLVFWEVQQPKVRIIKIEREEEYW